MQEALRRDFRVRGRVQGVGFRWSTRMRAQELGLGGSVRNLPDGSVAVSVVGEGGALERFLEWLRTGPPGARVDAVVEVEASPEPLPTSGFHIAR